MTLFAEYDAPHHDTRHPETAEYEAFAREIVQDSPDDLVDLLAVSLEIDRDCWRAVAGVLQHPHTAEIMDRQLHQTALDYLHEQMQGAYQR